MIGAKKELNIHFIWAGKRISVDIEFLLITKIILLERFYRNSNYSIEYNIWVDRPYLVDKLLITLRRYTSKVINIKIQNVEKLFNKFEADNVFKKDWSNKRFLRYYFLDQMNTISTYRGFSLANGVTTSSTLLDKFKPIPALGADVIKALIGYYKPGLYIDIGLSYNLNAKLDLSHILNYNNSFKESVYFAATVKAHETFDYQVVYTTDNLICKKIFSQILQAYINPQVHVDPHIISHNSSIFHTHRLNNNPITRSMGITTPLIWDPILGRNKDFYSCKRIKKKHIIPISIDTGSVGFFCYKKRENSPIDDYKSEISEEKLHQKLKGFIWKESIW